jgi:uncharacterized protein (TIGR03435 family)
MKRMVLAGLLCWGAVGVRAQSFPINIADKGAPAANDVKLPEFEVVSVKENKSTNGGMSINTSADGFVCRNISLKNLIANAYGVRIDLISGGPGWAETTGFDVDAKVAEEDIAALKKLKGPQRWMMLRATLADRFKLKVRLETKMLPMYELVVGKDGPKLKESTAVMPTDGGERKYYRGMPGSLEVGPGFFNGYGLTMETLANNLSFQLERTVVDKTGLKGKYDVHLQWKQEGTGPAVGEPDAGGSIFTAVEDLGLKLQGTKGPTETLVIEHAEMPSEN